MVVHNLFSVIVSPLDVQTQCPRPNNSLSAITGETSKVAQTKLLNTIPANQQEEAYSSQSWDSSFNLRLTVYICCTTIFAKCVS